MPAPAPPPPDTRTQEELDSIAMEFMASLPVASATAPTPPTEAADEPAPEPPPAEEPQTDAPTEPLTEPSADAGPEWLVTALQEVPEGALPAWLPDRMLKIAKHDSARNAQIKALESDLAAAKAAPPIVAEPTSADPLAHVGTEAQLREAVNQAQVWEDWCEANPEGGHLDPKNEESFIDADAVRANRIHARRILRAVPDKREWLKSFQATSAAVIKDRPTLGDKTSADYQAAVEILAKPLAARADYLQIVADYLTGKQAREDKARGVQTVKLNGNGHAKPAPAPAQPAARSSPGPSAPSVRAAGAPVDLSSLRQRAKEGDESAANQLATAFLESAA